MLEKLNLYIVALTMVFRLVIKMVCSFCSSARNLRNFQLLLSEVISAANNAVLKVVVSGV